MMTKFLVSVLILAVAAGVAIAAPEGTATYTVTFDATWSAETHPVSFPDDPHFSGLVGGVHNASADFWQEGQVASLGMKQMAEWGSQTTLMAEVSAAVTAGTAYEVLAGDVLWVSPGQTSLSLEASPGHTLVTLVTMIAPSPDWFAGVDGLDLSNGDAWQNEIVVPLYPFDAGTDSGADYESPDLVTNPPELIEAMTAGPFSVGVPVGTLTFQLQSVSAVELPRPTLALSARPNPFNPRTTLSYEVPAAAQSVRLAIYDVQGRLVRNLAAGTAPGRQAKVWNGLTNEGTRAPGGVYFARLTADEAVAVQKVTLLP